VPLLNKTNTRLTQKRIVFINPPYERIAPGYEFVKHITNNSPSLGLLHLAAEVRLHGYRPSIIESDICGLSIDKIANQVIMERPAYVGITLFTVGVWKAAAIARIIKGVLPQIKIIVGGPHISSMGSETIIRFPEFDYAVVGEGEKILIELLAALKYDTNLFTIPGIIYRDGSSIYSTPSIPANMVLDELPLPAWDLLPDFPRAYKPAIYGFPRGQTATFAASRGCPFHCKFCDTSTFGTRLRYYSPQKVFEMMQHLHDIYSVRHIMFVDDLFLASKLRTTELCNIILDSGLRITWACTARVDTVKPDILKLMKKAGCWEISFGLETGSKDLLKKMGKATEVKKSEQAVKWAAAAGIRVKGLFILGFPGEDSLTITQTKNFLRRIPISIMNLSKFTPYPGTPIYRDLYGTKICDDHWEKMNGMNFLWVPQGMSVDELNRQYRKILRSFYRRPEIVLHFSKLTFLYPNHLFRLIRFGLGYLSSKTRSILSSNSGLQNKRREKHLE